MTRVLVVEDNEDLALGLRNNLEIEGFEVKVAPDGSGGLQLASRWRPDLIVLDLMLPTMDGFEVIEGFRRRDASTPILILTARGEELDKVRALRLGADDYVTKPFGLMELIARVEALLRRTNKNTRQAVHRFGDIEVRTEAKQVLRLGQPVTLTPKEYGLLIALIDRAGAVASRVDLMGQVWGHSSAIISRTVDTHIAELRRKLERDPASPRHIVTVHKTGYRLDLQRPGAASDAD